jgi:ribosomal protein S18 acetylase RimI-like enzyme
MELSNRGFSRLHVDVRLRPVAEGDREFLYRLYASTRQEELSVVEWEPGQKEAFLRMQFEAQSRFYTENYPGASLQVIEVQGQPAGRLYVARWGTEIRIMDIALLPEFRRQGLGTALMQEILAEGQASGLPVTIHVERMNPALGLYQRLGFRLLEDKGVYWLMQWMPEQI